MLARFQTPVQCSAGHLYTTIWVPFGSLKALRLGRRRYQRCPVGHHWAMTRRLDTATATPEQLRQAGEVHDISLP